jgi:hypothetical protein
MEANLSIRFDCATTAERDKIVEYLSAEGRPVFEEEVEPEYRAFFNKIEELEYPESLESTGEKTVHAYFFLGGEFSEDAEAILYALLNAGVINLVAYLEADDYIEFFIGKDGSLGIYSNWEEKCVDQARNNLSKGFKYLDEISQKI